MLSLPNLKEMIAPIGTGIVTKWDAKNAAGLIKSFSKILGIQAKLAKSGAEGMARAGKLVRRRQDRILEANKAIYEIKSIELKIKAEKANLQAAEDKLKLQKTLVKQASYIEDFLRSKYTNKELYAWLDSTYKSFHYQSYNLAYDIAQRAEKAYQFETGDYSQTFIQYGYWNDDRDGIGCAEGLYLDLKRLEQAQLISRPYDFEVIKNYSLLAWQQPELSKLRDTGVTEFEIPEHVYDIDFPSHYFRRIKTVSVTVVRGGSSTTIVTPDIDTAGGVSCTLTLLENTYRTSPNASSASQYAQQTSGAFHSDRIPIDSIAVSTGLHDSGTFQLEFNGQHFLPFEGAGAISKWSLELPNNHLLFDYKTIRDVIIEVKYTAKGGGAPLKRIAAKAATDALKKISDNGDGSLAALLDLPNYFPDEWATFKATLTLDLSMLKTKLPFFARVAKPTSTKVSLFTNDAHIQAGELSLAADPQGVSQGFEGGITHDFDSNTRSFDLDFAREIRAGWTLTYSPSDDTRQPPDTMWMAVHYHL